MTIQYQPPSLIGASNASVNNAFLPPIKYARAPGSVMKHEYKSSKPKKQVKEMMSILWPEKKTFLKMPYAFKFNTRDRCVVCGTHKVWEASDPMRPPIPLHKVRKGYPMRGTYCDKHAALHKQYEMLENQILAEEHGLSFSAYIPKPKVPSILTSAPLTSLRQSDIEALSASGWTVRPPQMTVESPEDELFRLTMESHAINNRVLKLMTDGTNVVQQQQQQTIQNIFEEGVE
tara:strand:+ start:2031 stop:2726 length:696 start_codon:yes stop_codon:yes gene_type:complete